MPTGCPTAPSPRTAAPGATRFLDEIRPQLTPEQLARLHFVGRLPHGQLIRLYQVARAHVYLTYPFVLSLVDMLESDVGGCTGDRLAHLRRSKR